MGKDGYTPLHYASLSRKIRIAALLIKKGAKVLMLKIKRAELLYIGLHIQER